MSWRRECKYQKLENIVEYKLMFQFVYSQLQQGVGLGAEAYNGMVDCFRKIINNEGYVIIDLT